MDYRDRDFNDGAVKIDDNTFFKCTFAHCLLLYAGGFHTGLAGNTFGPEVKLRIEGAALDTLRFLATLYANPESRDLAIETLRRAGLPCGPAESPTAG